MTNHDVMNSTFMNSSLVTVIFLLGFLCSNIVTSSDNWPMFQHDPQHTGFSSSTMPTHLKEVWVYKDQSKPSPSLATSSDFVSVASYTSISTLNSIDGSLIMKKEYVTGFTTPAVTEKRVFLNSYDGLYCFDICTGERIWKYEIGFVTVYSSPIFVGNRMFVGSGPTMGWTPPEHWEEASWNSKRVACVDLETGRMIWEYQAQQSTEFSPAYSKGRVYVGCGRSVYCLDGQTGDLIWETSLEEPILSGLSLDGERVYVGVSSGIVCLDMGPGSVLWHFDCGTAVNTTPAVAYTKVYFGTPTGILYCLEAESGNMVWKIDTKRVSPPSETAITGEVLVADKKVAFGTGDGVLHVADAESRSIRKSVDLGDWSITSMALIDGRLIVGLWGGTVICFEESPFWGAVPFVVVSVVAVSVFVFFWYHRRKSLRSHE
jgi:outer membrane protein assembly factor BamB